MKASAEASALEVMRVLPGDFSVAALRAVHEAFLLPVLRGEARPTVAAVVA